MVVIIHDPKNENKLYHSNILSLNTVNIINNNTIECIYNIDNKIEKTILEYEDLDFNYLYETYTYNYIQFICVHIAIFEGFKYTSLFPKYFDLFGFEDYLTLELFDLFTIIQNKVFAQHRFENNNPHYKGPEIRCNKELLQTTFIAQSLKPCRNIDNIIECLVSSGGGKDSLLCMKLLTHSDVQFSTIQYSHTIYGEPIHQNNLISTLSNKCGTKDIHILNNKETFMDGKILDEYENIKTLCNAETPNGVFQCVLLSLQYGYKYLVVGHEKSADDPNFIWQIDNNTKEDVNHQWGKSLEAELLLFNYIQKYFSSDIHFFSILKPINDFVIMHALLPHEEFIPLTHSCNMAKPWCKKCPKCAYVWTCFLAYFDINIINNIFKENPFDKDELYEIFLEMMGAKDHKPFECIGEIGETQLALYSCLQKGLKGRVIDYFKDNILESLDIKELLNHYNSIDETNHNYPSEISEKILQQFRIALKSHKIPI